MGFVPLYCLLGTLLFAVLSDSFGMNGQKNSYTRFPKWNACVNASIAFEFRTDQADSLLMYTDDKGDNVTNNFFMVVLEGGSVVLTYKIDDKMDGSINIKLGPGLNDNRWHTVKVQRNRLETILIVDQNSDSRISLDEDIHFAHIPENNDVFFGGLPQDHFRTKLRYLALPSVMFKNVFRGDIRNVLYYNCTCKPVRGEMLESRNVDNRRPEACEARNPCGEALCISSDRGSQCKVVDTGCGSDNRVRRSPECKGQLTLASATQIVYNCSFKLICAGNMQIGSWYLLKGKQQDVFISDNATNSKYSHEDIVIELTHDNLTIIFKRFTEIYLDEYLCVHGKVCSNTLDLNSHVKGKEKRCSQHNEVTEQKSNVELILSLSFATVVVFGLIVTFYFIIKCVRSKGKTIYTEVLSPRLVYTTTL